MKTVKNILKNLGDKDVINKFIYDRGNYVDKYEGETELSIINSFNTFKLKYNNKNNNI